MPASRIASPVMVSVFGPNLRDQSKGQFHVHAVGCADIARTERRDPAYADPMTIEITCKDDAVLDVYSDFIEHNDCEPIEGYRSDLYFFPCCGNLPQTNDAPAATAAPAVTNLKARTALAASTAPASFAKSPTGPRDHAKIDAAFAAGTTDPAAIAKATKLSLARVENSLAARTA